MTDEDWAHPDPHILGMLLYGRATDAVDERGRPTFGETMLVLMNGGAHTRYVTLPKMETQGRWELILNTARPGATGSPTQGLRLGSHSLIALRFPESARRARSMRVPSSTYRLQLRAEFGFEDAAAIVPYLAALGVGDVYASPILASTSGSPHGYDGIDPTRIDEGRGGRAGFESLVAATQANGLGMLVDIVPNHLATSEQNRWWWDVLRRGRESTHARVFDIDWDAPGLGGKLLLPVLGRPLADVLEDGELTVDLEDPRGPVVRYFEHAFPLASYTEMLDLPLAELLELQHYVLADWREAAARINYRRFFDIADLVSLHQEDAAVFAATHAAILGLIADGSITGLRIDHVDGLADPAGYLERLHDATDGIYVVVEKILAADEDLPEDWPVAGTTGYEVLDAIGSVFVDAEGANELESLQARVAGVGRRSTRSRSRPSARSWRRAFPAICAPSPARSRRPGPPTSRRSRRSRRSSTSTGRTAATACRSATPIAPASPGRSTARADRCPTMRSTAWARSCWRALSRGAALAAALGPGCGQGSRGHRDLPLPRPRLAERGGRRPRRVPAHDLGPASQARHARTAVAGRADAALDARHQAQRGHPRPHRRALGPLGALRGGRDAPRRASRR